MISTHQAHSLWSEQLTLSIDWQKLAILTQIHCSLYDIIKKSRQKSTQLFEWPWGWPLGDLLSWNRKSLLLHHEKRQALPWNEIKTDPGSCIPTYVCPFWFAFCDLLFPCVIFFLMKILWTFFYHSCCKKTLFYSMDLSAIQWLRVTELYRSSCHCPCCSVKLTRYQQPWISVPYILFHKKDKYNFGWSYSFPTFAPSCVPPKTFMINPFKGRDSRLFAWVVTSTDYSRPHEALFPILEL